jgi:hypothetical protein
MLHLGSKTVKENSKDEGDGVQDVDKSNRVFTTPYTLSPTPSLFSSSHIFEKLIKCLGKPACVLPEEVFKGSRIGISLPLVLSFIRST